MDLDAQKGKKPVFNRLGGQSNADPKYQKVCFHWRAGKCDRFPCPFLHRELPQNGAASKRSFTEDNSGPPPRRGPTHNLASNWGRVGNISNSRVVRKTEKVCNYWVQGNCSFGERCKYLHCWSIGEGIRLLTTLDGHLKVVTGIALPSGSDKLYTGSKDESVRIWDCASGQCVHMANLGGELGCLVSEGPWVFIGLPNLVKALNTQNNMDLTLTGPVGQVYALVVGNDMLFAGTQDGSILAWKFN